MKHQRQEQIKKTNDLIAITMIVEHIKNDEIKKAVEVAEKRNFTPKQFGEITNMVDLPIEEIYKNYIRKG